VDKIGEIRRAYFEQHRSIKEIVRTLSVSRATVRKVIRGHKTEFKYARGVQPTPKLGDWIEVAAFTARSTSLSQPRSTPGSAWTTVPAISIAIDPARCLTAPAALGAPVAVTTGTNIGGSAAGRTRRPVRAALRHPNRCCGVMSCRRATSDTTTPGS
jgi:hypothetical protein